MTGSQEDVDAVLTELLLADADCLLASYVDALRGVKLELQAALGGRCLGLAATLLDDHPPTSLFLALNATGEAFVPAEALDATVRFRGTARELTALLLGQEDVLSALYGGRITLSISELELQAFVSVWTILHGALASLLPGPGQEIASMTLDSTTLDSTTRP